MTDFSFSAFFTSKTFIYTAIPLISAVLGIFIKTVSQNDRYYEFKKEDFAIGLELSLVSIVSIITHAVSALDKSVHVDKKNVAVALDEKFIYFPWLIIFFVFGAWGVSTIVRKYGWENERDMTWFAGIIIPLIYGFLSLYMSLIWITI